MAKALEPMIEYLLFIPGMWLGHQTDAADDE